MPINQGQYKVVSVESRKGGVGKTTVALLLARALVTASKKTTVLFLDLDIAGTETGRAAKMLVSHPLWEKKLHIVAPPKAYKNSDSEYFNLADVFEHYMSGESIPSPRWDLTSYSNYEIALKRNHINILSSILKRQDKAGNNGHTYGPALLFDDMHSAWFLEMLRELIQQAINSSNKEQERESNHDLVVIIDNAPGYSGFEPAIERWLTDLGPECGKFLFVATRDDQDIHACYNAINALHATFRAKAIATKTFFNLSIPELPNFDPTNTAQMEFLIRLAEAIEGDGEACNAAYSTNDNYSANCRGCGLCYYAQGELISRTLIEYYDDPTKYIAFLCNKVPTSLIEDCIPPFSHNQKNGTPEKTVANVFFSPRNIAVLPYQDIIAFQFVKRNEQIHKHQSFEIFNKKVPEINEPYVDFLKKYNNFLLFKNHNYYRAAFLVLKAYYAALNTLFSLTPGFMPETMSSYIYELLFDINSNALKAYTLHTSIIPTQQKGIIDSEMALSFLSGVKIDQVKIQNHVSELLEKKIYFKGDTPLRRNFWLAIALALAASNSTQKKFPDMADGDKTLLRLSVFDAFLALKHKHFVDSPTKFITIRFLRKAHLDLNNVALQRIIPDFNNFFEFYKLIITIREQAYRCRQDLRFATHSLRSILKIAPDNPSAVPYYAGLMHEGLVQRSIPGNTMMGRVRDLDAIFSVDEDSRKLIKLPVFNTALTKVAKQWELIV